MKRDSEYWYAKPGCCLRPDFGFSIWLRPSETKPRYAVQEECHHHAGVQIMTTTNREILERLFREGGINLVRGAIFDRVPPPLPAEFDFAKVEGMMLGLAVGDALGNTSEGQLPSLRRERYGEIRDYLPNWYADNRPVGVPSDDTQMAFWTLEQMLEDGRLDPARLAERFSRGRIFGIGGTVKQFLRNYKSGLPWEQCGAASAGNGALMRIAPVLIPHLKSPTPELWADAALAAMLTHNDAGSTAACVAFVSMLWDLLAMTAPPAPEWWLETYVRTASELEGDTRYEPRSEAVAYYRGSGLAVCPAARWRSVSSGCVGAAMPATPGTRARTCWRRCRR
jgi:ADP-ribosyl-[dinitrogen reductase] hydrolase